MTTHVTRISGMRAVICDRHPNRVVATARTVARAYELAEEHERECGGSDE